jgi:hypothetical protein
VGDGKLTSGYDKFNIYYSDTDSGLMDSEAYEKTKYLFSNICELKNELKEGNYITDLFINSPKEYAYFTNDESEYAVKTHGVGARARAYKPVLEKLFRALKDGKSKDEAIDLAIKEANLLRSFKLMLLLGRLLRVSKYIKSSRLQNSKNFIL